MSTSTAGVVEAWRVDFTSAGVANQAWYAVDGDRRLVKYAIARGPTLVLERVSPQPGRHALSRSHRGSFA